MTIFLLSGRPKGWSWGKTDKNENKNIASFHPVSQVIYFPATIASTVCAKPHCHLHNYFHIYYPKLTTQHQITLYFQRIETVRKTQPVHCFVSFFNISFFLQTTTAFCVTEKEIIENSTKEKENMLVISIFFLLPRCLLSDVKCALFCQCLEKKGL